MFVAIKTKNGLNQRQHWRTVSKRAIEIKSATAIALSAQAGVRGHHVRRPCVVVMTRSSTGVLDDDGLASSLKHVRDAVAEWLGVDDGDTGAVRFKCEQGTGKRGVHGVQIEVHEETRLVETMVSTVVEGFLS